MDGLIVFLAKDLFIFVILIWLITYFIIEHPRRLEFIAALIAAGVLALILYKTAGALYFHPRPFVANPAIKPLFPHGADNGFPSEHTVLVMSLTALIYFYHRRLAVVAFILTLLVGAGRVWAHVHSWIDILGGLVIGAIAGYAGVKLAKFLFAKKSSAKLPVDHR